MTDTILAALEGIEKDNNVTILYACESGSRAWGFASVNSDYDVRFIYKHPLEHYLQIDDKRDVIELPMDEVLDVNGWDIRKALKLFRNANAPLYEWLQSPIVYKKDDNFFLQMQGMMNEYFSLRAGVHHYLSMTVNTFRNDMQGEKVRLKKYFYALRPLLAAKWICEKQQLPPMQFHLLRTLIDDAHLQQLISELMNQKSVGNEKDDITPVTVLHTYIEDQIAIIDMKAKEIKAINTDANKLNKLFRETVNGL